MGNHEADVGIEDSITRLFAAQGIRMLRQERAPIRHGDEMLNLIGIDHGSDLAPDVERQVEGDRRLQRLKGLVMPNTVNILLIHYPHAFGDLALGIDFNAFDEADTQSNFVLTVRLVRASTLVPRLQVSRQVIAQVSS
jgi:hypothetical protein